MSVLSRFLHKRETVPGQTGDTTSSPSKGSSSGIIPKSIQADMKEALSDKKYGCSNTILVRIAQAAEGEQGKNITRTVLDGLHQKSSKWRLIYKALTLIEFILKFGPPEAKTMIQQNAIAIRALKEFYVVENMKDCGNGIREKSNYILSLLDNDEYLSQQREEAQKSYARVSGIGSNGERTGAASQQASTEDKSASKATDQQTAPSAQLQKTEKEDFIKAALQQENELRIQRAEKQRNKLKKQRERAKKRAETIEEVAVDQSKPSSSRKQESFSNHIEHQRDLEDDDFSDSNGEIYRPTKSVQHRSRKAATRARIRRRQSPINSTPPPEPLDFFQPQAGVVYPKVGMPTPSSFRQNLSNPMIRPGTSSMIPNAMINQRGMPLQATPSVTPRGYAGMPGSTQGTQASQFSAMQAGFPQNYMTVPPQNMIQGNQASMQMMGFPHQAQVGIQRGSMQPFSRSNPAGTMIRQNSPQGLVNGFPVPQQSPMGGNMPMMGTQWIRMRNFKGTAQALSGGMPNYPTGGTLPANAAASGAMGGNANPFRKSFPQTGSYAPPGTGVPGGFTLQDLQMSRSPNNFSGFASPYAQG